MSDGEGGSPGSQGRNWSANIAGLSVRSSVRYRQPALPQIMPLDSEPDRTARFDPEPPSSPPRSEGRICPILLTNSVPALQLQLIENNVIQIKVNRMPLL